MRIPCVRKLDFIVNGLAFLAPTLSAIQFDNLTMVATALVLGARFKLTDFSLMWLETKCVSTLSYFFSDSKVSFYDMSLRFAYRVQCLYPLSEGGYFQIDDTMQHHSIFCKLIHGVFWLFDHALKTNLKTKCIVVLYYSDGMLIKFPKGFRVYHKEAGKKMPWQKHCTFVYKTKYELAIELIEEALNQGFPKSTVLADSWFGIHPFVKELKRLGLSFVLEIRSSYKVKKPCETPKLTPKGRLAKNQFDSISLGDFFDSLSSTTKVGFAYDMETGKKCKVLYHLKVATVVLNAFSGKYRLVQSRDPVGKTVKYLLSNELNWEARKIVSDYSCRWVIEEFFRNAKQLTNLEGACLRSEQGVALALHLVSWIDFLLHYENYKLCTADKLSKGPLTVQSIIRRAQAENTGAFIEKIKNDEVFTNTWIGTIKKGVYRNRKKRWELVDIVDHDEKVETTRQKAA